jgi:hypothetical protein
MVPERKERLKSAFFFSHWLKSYLRVSTIPTTELSRFKAEMDDISQRSDITNRKQRDYRHNSLSISPSPHQPTSW